MEKIKLSETRLLNESKNLLVVSEDDNELVLSINKDNIEAIYINGLLYENDELLIYIKKDINDRNILFSFNERTAGMILAINEYLKVYDDNNNIIFFKIETMPNYIDKLDENKFVLNANINYEEPNNITIKLSTTIICNNGMDELILLNSRIKDICDGKEIINRFEESQIVDNINYIINNLLKEHNVYMAKGSAILQIVSVENSTFLCVNPNSTKKTIIKVPFIDAVYNNYKYIFEDIYIMNDGVMIYDGNIIKNKSCNNIIGTTFSNSEFFKYINIVDLIKDNIRCKDHDKELVNELKNKLNEMIISFKDNTDIDEMLIKGIFYIYYESPIIINWELIEGLYNSLD